MVTEVELKDNSKKEIRIPRLVTKRQEALLDLMEEKGFGVFDTLSFENGQPMGAKRLLENIRF